MSNEEQLREVFKKILKGYVMSRNTGIWGKREGLINEVNIDNIVDDILREVKIRTDLRG